jgi:hypothetical protein
VICAAPTDQCCTEPGGGEPGSCWANSTCCMGYWGSTCCDPASSFCCSNVGWVSEAVGTCCSHGTACDIMSATCVAPPKCAIRGRSTVAPLNPASVIVRANVATLQDCCNQLVLWPGGKGLAGVAVHIAANNTFDCTTFSAVRGSAQAAPDGHFVLRRG